MHVGITGSSGLIGSALSSSLRADGHSVTTIVRRKPRAGEIRWNPNLGELEPDDLVGMDAVVHLAGAGVGDRRWSDRRKQELVDSRVRSTRLLAKRLADLGDDGPRVLLSGSAIGVYGDRGDEPLDETSARGDGFLADICDAWESATEPAAAGGIRVAHLRTGIVLTPDGGALAKMLPIFKLGVGGRFGDGRQWMSWISIDDEVHAITHLLTSDLAGPVNLTAPHAVRNTEFATTLATVLQRPSLLPVPRFAPRLLLGSELADSLLFDGQRVEPGRLVADGFRFEHAALETALRAVLDRA